MFLESLVTDSKSGWNYENSQTLSTATVFSFFKFLLFINFRYQVRHRNFVTRGKWAARKSTKRYVASAQELRKNLVLLFFRSARTFCTTHDVRKYFFPVSSNLLLSSIKSLITQSMCWVDMPSALGVVSKFNLADLSRTNCSCFHCSYFSIFVVVNPPRDILLIFWKCVRMLRVFVVIFFHCCYFSIVDVVRCLMMPVVAIFLLICL